VRFQVAAFNVRNNLSFLVHEGLCADILYKKVGLTREQLDEPGMMVDVSVSEALVNYGADQLNAPDLGFRIGQWGDSGRWGVLGHIVDCAQSIQQALTLQQRYQSLVGTGSKSEFSIDNKRVLLKWVPHYTCGIYLQEEVVTSWVAFAKKAISLKLKPLEIHFSHSLVTNIKDYQDFFECPVYFDSDFTGIIFPEAILNLPLVGYNPDLLNVLMSYANIIVSKKQKNAANEIITQYIMDTLSEKVPTLADAAEFLGLSTRSLQRKFKEQGTNFKSIVDDVRKEYAFSYLLQSNYKMSYISQVLGFSEQSVFQRAFKRWTGITPGEYRESNGKNSLHQ
jgi:AraC-like DNA-binding protein